MEIVFATGNANKLKEIQAILADTPFQVVSMAQAGFQGDILEDGDTFEANAAKKAITIAKATGKITLADDSGLEVDALDKAPGVYSARYMGEDTPYEVKNNHILTLLRDVPEEKRTARFVCVIAAAIPVDGHAEPMLLTERAALEGRIADSIRGQGGFGYDPILYVDSVGLTTGEMDMEQKNRISHRGQALRQMKSRLLAYTDLIS